MEARTLSTTVPEAAPGPLPTPRKLRLTGEILALYVRARWVMRRHDLRKAVRILRGPAGEAAFSPDQMVAGLRLGRVVQRSLGHLPFDSRCLVTSLVLCGLLARRGVHSTVALGVRPGGDFAAHAWVELEGEPLLPPQASEYERLLTV